MEIKRLYVIAFTSFLLALTIWFLYHLAPVSAPAASVFKTIKGETIRLAELKGRPVLVTFWASDCPACIKEIPQLIGLQQEFATQGLTIIAIAMYYDPPHHVMAMTVDKRLPYDVVLDPDAEHAKAFGNVQAIPSSFLIDRQGMIVLQNIGIFDVELYRKKLSER